MMDAPRPNILWVCADQQRADTLGCYGNTWVRTPHLDALAAEGIRFTSAFSQSPMCSPSRAGFLTGRYPRTTRLRQNGQALPSDERLITRTLADDGCSCGLVGKLHLAACDPAVCPDMEPRGDDVHCEYCNAGEPLDGGRPWGTMLRTARHKVTVYHGTGEGELYDLQADPFEKRNLWNAPGLSALKADPLNRLCDRMAQTVDPLPARPARW